MSFARSGLFVCRKHQLTHIQEGMIASDATGSAYVCETCRRFFSQGGTTMIRMFRQLASVIALVAVFAMAGSAWAADFQGQGQERGCGQERIHHER